MTHVNWLIFVMESGTEPDIKLIYRARMLSDSESVGKRNRGDESTANASSA